MKTGDLDTAMWGIHAGRGGDADSLFLKKNRIAVGWFKMGDLKAIEPNREAFKTRVAEVFPEKKPGAIPNNAGQLYRFVHEIRVDDLIVYPSKRDKRVHVGKVVGDYVYDPSVDATYPNLRAVQWIGSFPRTRFSQGALYEIGSAISLFLVKNYADEFRAAVDGQETNASSVSQDDTVAAVAQDIEETTRDFVLKRLAQELKGHPFSDFIAHLLNAMGYRTRVAPEGPDGGIDIIAHKDELGFEPPIVKIQVKSSEGSVGDPVVSSLYGKVGTGEYGLLVTLGTYTTQARNFAKSQSNLRLIDGDELVQLVFQYYDQFDVRYKSLLPLRRVYVPEAIGGDEE